MGRTFRGAVFGIVAVSALVLAGCGGGSGRGRETRVLDTRGVLGEEAVAAIEAADVPEGYALVVSVVSYDPDEPIGPQADRAAAEAAARCDDVGRCDERGIFVLVDADEGFPQLRVGDALRLDAAWGGATYGPEYLDRQLRALGTPDEQVRGLVPWAVEAVEGADGSPSFTARALDGFGYGALMTEVLTVSYPVEGAYERFMVRPLLRLHLLERDLLGTWFVTPVVVIGALALALQLLREPARQLSAMKRREPSVLLGLASAVAAAIVMFPMAAAITLQSDLRLEDHADVVRIVEGIPPIDLWGDGWAPPRSLLLSLLILLFALAHRAVSLIDRSGPGFLLTRGEQDSLVAQGLVPAWVAGRSLEYQVETAPVRLVAKVLWLPLALTVASYSLLPPSLVLLLMLGLVMRTALLLFPALDTWRLSTAWAEVAAGRPASPERTQPVAPRGRQALAVLTVGLVALVVWAARDDTTTQALDRAVLPTTTTVAASTTAPPTTLAAFSPADGRFDTWPADTGKPSLAPGATGDAVSYLQGVLKVKAQREEVTVDGVYGPTTEAAIRELQVFFGLPETGTVDSTVWQIIDGMAVYEETG